MIVLRDAYAVKGWTKWKFCVIWKSGCDWSRAEQNIDAVDGPCHADALKSELNLDFQRP